MSSKVKERLKRLMLELLHEERIFLDNSLEQLTGKTCDEAIEMLSDEQIKDIVEKIKIKKRKKKMEMEEPIPA
jgi:hypothetical protein